MWKTAFKKLPKQTISLQIFLRLSSTNFTWSILEYFDPSYGMSFIDLEQQTFIASFIPGLRETAQKMKFFVKGLVTFTEETLNGKLHFFMRCKSLYSELRNCNIVRVIVCFSNCEE